MEHALCFWWLLVNSGYHDGVMIRGLVFLLLAVPAVFAQSDVDQTLAKERDLVGKYKYQEAQSLLKNLLKRNPNCGRCYLEQASLNFQMQDGMEALKSLDKAIAVADTNEVKVTAHHYKGVMLMQGDKKQVAQAEQEFRQVLALDPKHASTHLKLGLLLMRQNRQDEGAAELHQFLASGSALAEDVAYVNKVLAKPQLASETPAPDFSVKTNDGRTISLSENVGKIVVLDFWATWCPPCRASVPEIKEMVRKYPADKLVVISSSADQDEKAWREFIAKKEMTWPQYHDADNHLAQLFNVNAYPTYIVIDRDGFIRRRFTGQNPRESISHKLRDELKSILE